MWEWLSRSKTLIGIVAAGLTVLIRWDEAYKLLEDNIESVNSFLGVVAVPIGSAFIIGGGTGMLASFVLWRQKKGRESLAEARTEFAQPEFKRCVIRCHGLLVDRLDGKVVYEELTAELNALCGTLDRLKIPYPIVAIELDKTTDDWRLFTYHLLPLIERGEIETARELRGDPIVHPSKRLIGFSIKNLSVQVYFDRSQQKDF